MTAENRAEKLLRELASISMLAEVIKICYLNAIKGTRFKNPRIYSKAEKIQSFANSIQTKELKGYIKIDPNWEETMQNEHALHLYRIMDHFMFMPTEQLEEFANGIEKPQEL